MVGERASPNRTILARLPPILVAPSYNTMDQTPPPPPETLTRSPIIPCMELFLSGDYAIWMDGQILRDSPEYNPEIETAQVITAYVRGYFDDVHREHEIRKQKRLKGYQATFRQTCQQHSTNCAITGTHLLEQSVLVFLKDSSYNLGVANRPEDLNNPNARVIQLRCLLVCRRCGNAWMVSTAQPRVESRTDGSEGYLFFLRMERKQRISV